jgi:LPXTG-motif cell wall-anchored protein
MNKLITLAGTTAALLVVAATVATPALAYQSNHSDYSPQHSQTHHTSNKKDCPPKKTTHKTVETKPEKDCPPKTTPPKHTKKPCPPKEVEKPTPVEPTPVEVKPVVKHVETKPVSVTKPETLPNTGAGSMLFPAAGITGALGYAGNLIRLKRKNVQ